MQKPRNGNLAAALRLVRLSLAADLRNPALRLLALAGALAAGVFGHEAAGSAASTSIALATWLGRAYGIGASLWLGYAAVRDQNEQLGGVLRSKPVDGAFWVTLNWAGGMALWLILLAFPFLGAAIGQWSHQGPVVLAAHAIGFARAAQVVLLAGTLSFALSRMMRSPLGGLIILLAWFCAMVGFGLIPSYLQPDYTQNGMLYLSAAATLLAAAGLLVERFRRGELRQVTVPVAVVLALLLVTAAGAARVYQLAPKPEQNPHDVWEQMALQHLEKDRRVPGFRLPDGKGGLVGTADYHGKILLIYLFNGGDADAGRMLLLLDNLRREYADRGVQPLGVCISGNHGDGWTLSRAGGLGFPIGSDLSTVGTQNAGSALLTAYDVDTLPLLVVTDRRRIVRQITRQPNADPAELARMIDRQLAESGG
jgi:hypothetical protein